MQTPHHHPRRAPVQEAEIFADQFMNVCIHFQKCNIFSLCHVIEYHWVVESLSDSVDSFNDNVSKQ